MTTPNFDSSSDRTQRLNQEVARMNERVGQFIDGLTLFWAQQDQDTKQPIGPEQRRAIEYTTMSDMIFGVTGHEEIPAEETNEVSISDDAVRKLRLRQLLTRARGAAREEELADEGHASE